MQGCGMNVKSFDAHLKEDLSSFQGPGTVPGSSPPVCLPRCCSAFALYPACTTSWWDMDWILYNTAALESGSICPRNPSARETHVQKEKEWRMSGPGNVLALWWFLSLRTKEVLTDCSLVIEQHNFSGLTNMILVWYLKLRVSQVTTHSRLLSDNDLTDIAEACVFPRANVDRVSLQQFHTEQQFCHRVRWEVLTWLDESLFGGSWRKM